MLSSKIAPEESKLEMLLVYTNGPIRHGLRFFFTEEKREGGDKKRTGARYG